MSTRTQPGTHPPPLVWGLSRGQVRSRTSEQTPLRWMFSAAGSEQRESGLPKEEGRPGHREGEAGAGNSQSGRAGLLAGILPNHGKGPVPGAL